MEKLLTDTDVADIIPTKDELRILKNLREKAALMQYGIITMDITVDFAIHDGEIKKGEMTKIRPRL